MKLKWISTVAMCGFLFQVAWEINNGYCFKRAFLQIISALVVKKYSRTFPKQPPKMWRVSAGGRSLTGGRCLREVVCTWRFNLAYEQAFWGALAAGQEKEGALATASLEFKFHLQFPCGSPSTELSDFCQSAWSRNKHECKQTSKNTWEG